MKEKQTEEENLQEMLKEDYLHASYLDKFPLNEKYNLPNITAVIPTFNRSPHVVKEDSNPLGWCLESLLAQRGSGLDEIIIVDDASTDYTKDVVRTFQEKSSVPIIYLNNEKNLGSSISRNIAVKHSKNDLVMFLDDDCVFSKYMFFGANFTLDHFDESVSALHLPVYHRKTIPKLVDINDIGVLDLKKGVIVANFDGFPIQYLNDLENHLIDTDLKILTPIEIKNLAGVFLIKKRIFEKIGGFPEFFTWKNGYREETDVALKLSEGGYKMLFTPDPKFFCVHLKYGADGEKNEKEAEPNLKSLIEQSNIHRCNTGNRVDTAEWFYSLLLSTYTLLGRRNSEGAKRYLYETYKNFVINNQLIMPDIERKIDDFKTRKNIFDRVVEEGNRVLGNENSISYQ